MTTAKIAWGAPASRPPDPSTGHTHGSSTVSTILRKEKTTNKLDQIYDDRQFTRYLAGDAPVFVKNTEMIIYHNIPSSISSFDFADAAREQIGATLNCRPLGTPNWAKTTKTMGIIFENEDDSIKAETQGLTIDGNTYLPSPSFPSNWTFMKFTLIGLPSVRDPSRSLIEPIRKMFASLGQLGRIQLCYQDRNNQSLFMNRAFVYVFGIDTDIEQEIERNPDIKPSMELQYKGLKFPVCAGWKGSAPFCNYCKQSDHTIGKCPIRLSLKCKSCGNNGHVSSGCERYGQKNKHNSTTQAAQTDIPTTQEPEKESVSTPSPENPVSQPTSEQPDDDLQSVASDYEDASDSQIENASTDLPPSSISDADTDMQEQGPQEQPSSQSLFSTTIIQEQPRQSLFSTTVVEEQPRQSLFSTTATPKQASPKGIHLGDCRSSSYTIPYHKIGTRSQTRPREASDPESSTSKRANGGRGRNKKTKT
jgi:hypothetical protein